MNTITGTSSIWFNSISFLVTPILSIAGPIMFFLFLFSTAMSGYNVMIEKTTKALSVAPFTTLVVNCTIWSL